MQSESQNKQPVTWYEALMNSVKWIEDMEKQWGDFKDLNRSRASPIKKQSSRSSSPQKKQKVTAYTVIADQSRPQASYEAPASASAPTAAGNTGNQSRSELVIRGDEYERPDFINLMDTVATEVERAASVVPPTPVRRSVSPSIIPETPLVVNQANDSTRQLLSVIEETPVKKAVAADVALQLRGQNLKLDAEVEERSARSSRKRSRTSVHKLKQDNPLFSVSRIDVQHFERNASAAVLQALPKDKKGKLIVPSKELNLAMFNDAKFREWFDRNHAC